MKTYLVQRGKIEERTFKKGIDSIIQFDYMGASEYEWGALPKSLETIRREISQYQYTDLMVKGRSVTIFTPAKFIPELPEYLKKLAEGKMQLKCGSRFDCVFATDDLSKRLNNSDFWWDIENHLMWWLTNVEFEDKFKKLIINTPA